MIEAHCERAWICDVVSWFVMSRYFSRAVSGFDNSKIRGYKKSSYSTLKSTKLTSTMFYEQFMYNVFSERAWCFQKRCGVPQKRR